MPSPAWQFIGAAALAACILSAGVLTLLGAWRLALYLAARHAARPEPRGKPCDGHPDAGFLLGEAEERLFGPIEEHYYHRTAAEPKRRGGKKP